MKKSYYAIIPADVRYAKISANAKLLYGEITALANEKGYCWASNQYFADLYEVDSRTISRWVNELKKNNFITYSIKDKNIRHISVVGVRQKARGGTTKLSGGVRQKAEHNNTSNTTVNNTTTSKQSLPTNDFIDLFKEVNPNHEMLFKNKTQRDASNRLLKKHGFEKLKDMIPVIKVSNTKEYHPVITTPLQLEMKMGNLITAIQKTQNSPINQAII